MLWAFRALLDTFNVKALAMIIRQRTARALRACSIALSIIILFGGVPAYGQSAETARAAPPDLNTKERAIIDATSPASAVYRSSSSSVARYFNPQ
jgi:hypothetical protein